MEVKVNGRVQAYDSPDASVLDILKGNKVEKPELVVVQLNGAFVSRELYESTNVKSGDEIDFLFPMGGGH